MLPTQPSRVQICQLVEQNPTIFLRTCHSQNVFSVSSLRGEKKLFLWIFSTNNAMTFIDSILKTYTRLLQQKEGRERFHNNKKFISLCLWRQTPPTENNPTTAQPKKATICQKIDLEPLLSQTNLTFIFGFQRYLKKIGKCSGALGNARSLTLKVRGLRPQLAGRDSNIVASNVFCFFTLKRSININIVLPRFL